MSNKNGSHSEPYVLDQKNDPSPTKGTDKPWERPGQKSQNPSEPDAPKPDLDRWNKSIQGK